MNCEERHYTPPTMNNTFPSNEVNFFVNMETSHHHNETIAHSISTGEARSDIETMFRTAVDRNQTYSNSQRRNTGHHGKSDPYVKMTLQSSLHELDEAIASVKNVCLSPRKGHNDEDHMSVGSTILSTLDSQSQFTHPNSVIDNMHDVNTKTTTTRTFRDVPSIRSRPYSRSDRSRNSTRSRTSRSSRASSSRKERKFDRIVRATIYQHVDYDSESFIMDDVVQPTDSADSGCGRYSTNDILNDLMRINTAVLTTEARMKTARDQCTIDSQQWNDDNRIVQTTVLSSNDRTKMIQERDYVLLHAKSNTNQPQQPPALLAALQQDDEDDDAMWIQDRIGEPKWANLSNDNSFNMPIVKPAKKRIVRNSNKTNDAGVEETWTPWCQPDSFDDWGFEELDFPNSNSSTADDNKNKKQQARGRLESKLSNESDAWTSFGGSTPFSRRETNDDVSHQSPSSVLDYDITPPLTSTPKQKKKNGNGAWQRRLVSKTRAVI